MLENLDSEMSTAQPDQYEAPDLPSALMGDESSWEQDLFSPANDYLFASNTVGDSLEFWELDGLKREDNA